MVNSTLYCSQRGYNRTRYYNPQTGRFLSEDPLDFYGSDFNLYRYVLNNPVNLSDPFGLIPPTSPEFAGGASGGGISGPFSSFGSGAGANAGGAVAGLICSQQTNQNTQAPAQKCRNTFEFQKRLCSKFDKDDLDDNGVNRRERCFKRANDIYIACLKRAKGL